MQRCSQSAKADLPDIPDSQGDMLELNQESSWSLCVLLNVSVLLCPIPWSDVVQQSRRVLKPERRAPSPCDPAFTHENLLLSGFHEELSVCDQKLCDARRDRWKMCFLSRWILIRFFPENRPLVMFYSSFNALMRFSKLPRHEKACLGNLPLACSCLLYCHILNRPKTWVLRTELNHSLVKLPLLPAWKL